MIPFNISTPRNNYRAYASFSIIVISVLFFLWEMGLSVSIGKPIETVFSDYALVPCMVNQQSFFVTVLSGIRSLFLTTGFTQFLLNMVFFWLFAPRVEQYMGHRGFIMFFLAVGFGGHVTTLLFNGMDCVPLVGPNSAIAGTMAAFLLLYPAQKVDVFISFLVRRFTFPSALFILIYLAISIFSPSGGPLSGVVEPYWYEVGGFVMGLLIIFIITMFKSAPPVDPFRHLDD